MKTLLPLVTTCLFTLLGSTAATAVDTNTTPATTQDAQAIINGTSASTTTYPWIVYLAYDTGQQYCGGSLISPTWILTAAHCFLNEAGDEVDIVEGAKSGIVLASDTVDPPGPDAIAGAIGQIIVHPQYQPNSATSPNANDFDIALVEITAAVSLQTVALLAADAPLLTEGTLALIMGWGTTAVNSDNEGIDPSNTLLKASQKIIGTQACAAVYGDSLTTNMICAGGLDTSDTTDTCQGDSGGPLTIANGDSFIQVGIVSFGGADEGPSCGDPNAPGVYASVSALAGFIAQYATDATFSNFASAAPAPMAPVLTTAVNGNTVTLSWTATATATGYTLYYAPYPAQSPIASLDMGTATTISASLPSGSDFYVAVIPYTAAGEMNLLSNIGVFMVP